MSQLGLVEHCVDLGDEVKSGQLIAKVHNIERTGSPPDEYHAKIDGIFTGKHFPGHVVNGDFLGRHCSSSLVKEIQ